MASSNAWKELLLKKKKTNKESLNLDENQEHYFRFTKALRHSSGLLSRFIYQLIESEKVYIETLDTGLNTCIHLSEIKNVGFEEFIERLTLFRNSCQEFLENLQKKNDEKIFISYITSANFYKIYQDYISHFSTDFLKIQKAKNENSRLQIQLKDIDLYLNAPFRRVFFYRAIYWNILRCKNQKSKIDDNKIIHSLNSLVNSIIGCKSELNIEKDDFMRIARFEQDLDSSKVNVNGENMAIFTYLCNGINTSPIENTPNIINNFNLDKITVNNSDFEKSIKENVTITIFSDFLIITKDTYSQKNSKDNNISFSSDANGNVKVKSQLLYPPIPLKDVSIIERKVPRYLQKLNHIHIIESNGGFDSIKLKKIEIDESELTYNDYVFELRCTNPQIFIVLQAECEEDRESFMTSIKVQRNCILNNNQDIYFDNLGQFVIATYKPKTPNIIIEGDITNKLIKNVDNKKSYSNMSIDVENTLNEAAYNNENIDLSSEKNELQNIYTLDESKFNNTTLFQATCSPYYFKQNEWIKMPKSIICIHQNSDGRNFISLNASATGRTLLNEYICPDSVIRQSSKNENVIQIKTKSRGLFSIRFGKNDTIGYNTLLSFSKDLINDSICWNYEKKEDLFLIEKSPSLDFTYDLVIKNNIDDSSTIFKMYCEKTTKYEIINQLYIKEGNNWVSLGLSRINFIIPNYIMEKDVENSENLAEMEFLNKNSIEPIITAHSIINSKRSANQLMCFLRAPINQDCIILKNKNIHDDNVYELNFMYEEKIFEYMIYSKKADHSLAFVSEFINKLSNYYSKTLDDKCELFKDPDLLADITEQVNKGNVSSIDINDSEEVVINHDNNKEEEIKNNNDKKEEEKIDEEEDEEEEKDEENNEEKVKIISDNNDNDNSSKSNNESNNLLSDFTFMSTNEKPSQQKSEGLQLKNNFVFDMNDFSTDSKTTDKEDNQNSTSIFSGFSIPINSNSNSNVTSNTKNAKEDTENKAKDSGINSNSLFVNKSTIPAAPLNANLFGFTFGNNSKATENVESKSNDSNPLFSNKPAIPISPLNQNSFGFSFNSKSSTDAKTSIAINKTENSEGQVNASTTTTTTNTNVSNPLFSNKSSMPVAAPLNINSFGFSFSNNKSNSTKTATTDNESEDNKIQNNDSNISNPLFSNKSKIPVAPLNINSFGFSFNNNSNTKKPSEAKSDNNNNNNNNNTNPLFNNSVNKTGLFENAQTPLSFGTTGNFGFNFTSSTTLPKREVNETKLPPPNTNTVAAMSDREEIENKQNNEISSKEDIEIKKDETFNKKENENEKEQKLNIIIQKNNTEISDSVLKEDNKKNEKITSNIKEIPSNNLQTEVDTSMSCTLYDVSEPYNSPRPETRKLADKLPNNDFYDDISNMKNGKLLSLGYNHFVRSCDDLCVRAQNIAISYNRDLSNENRSSMQNINYDSILNLKNKIKLRHKEFNESDASILTYNGENSSKTSENSGFKDNNIIKKTKSVSELEIKSILKEYNIKGYNITIENKELIIENNEISTSNIINENLSQIHGYKETIKNEIKIVIEDVNDIKNQKEEVVKDEPIISNNNNNNNNNNENISIVEEEIKKETLDKNHLKKEENAFKFETENKNEDKCTKTGLVANLVSNINNNNNNNYQSNIKKEDESCVNQHLVDKMAKEYEMKEELNNNSQIFIKSEKVKCLRLSPSSNENMTNEELLSLYIKSLRPVKKQENKSNNIPKIKEEDDDDENDEESEKISNDVVKEKDKENEKEVGTVEEKKEEIIDEKENEEDKKDEKEEVIEVKENEEDKKDEKEEVIEVKENEEDKKDEKEEVIVVKENEEDKKDEKEEIIDEKENEKDKKDEKEDVIEVKEIEEDTKDGKEEVGIIEEKKEELKIEKNDDNKKITVDEELKDEKEKEKIKIKNEDEEKEVEDNEMNIEEKENVNNNKQEEEIIKENQDYNENNH